MLETTLQRTLHTPSELLLRKPVRNSDWDLCLGLQCKFD